MVELFMSNKYIEIKHFKTLLLLVPLVMLSVSCTKERRSEIIIREIENETEQTQNITTERNEYRYVIIRSNKKIKMQNI